MAVAEAAGAGLAPSLKTFLSSCLGAEHLVNKHTSNPSKNVLFTTGHPSLWAQLTHFKICQDYFSLSCIFQGPAGVTSSSNSRISNCAKNVRKRPGVLYEPMPEVKKKMLIPTFEENPLQ